MSTSAQMESTSASIIIPQGHVKCEKPGCDMFFLEGKGRYHLETVHQMQVKVTFEVNGIQ
ncbi:hypothetical protein HDU76_011478, partial [Blyttiomyces sp. JEL0837]